MRTGAPEIAVSMGPRLLHLKPSLRCACRLHDRHGGFEPLARSILDGTVHSMADVIAEGAPGQFDNRTAVEIALAANLDQLDAIIPQLLAFLFALTGADHPAASEGKSETVSLSMTLPEFYERLFRVATGWLGWTPDTAWNATPAEILAAYRGRTELLETIFGGSTDETSGTQTPDHPAELDLEGLEALRSMGGF